MVAADRLQGFLRWKAEQQASALLVPPFTIFLHPGNVAGEDDHAVPDEPLAGDVRAPLAEVRGPFEARAQRLRVRFVAEFAPELARRLRAAGLVEEPPVELLVCTRETFRQPAAVPGLTMVTLTADSPLADIREGLDTNEQGFDPGPMPVTDTQAEEFRRGLGESRAFTARLHGQPAGAGMSLGPHAGVSELTGITTVCAFRRRGVASSLTAFAARAAFECGVELVYLTTDNPDAKRVPTLGLSPIRVMALLY